MANLGLILKTAGSVVAATVAILNAVKENPHLGESATKAIDKLKSATNSENPRLRFEAKITAIQACADAVEKEFDRADEAAEWRRDAAALRVRGDLAWNANHGKARRRAMREINAETEELLSRMNERLVELTEKSPDALSDEAS